MSDPVRTCIGCRMAVAATARKSGWVRVAADSDGRLRIGRDVPGRGAWICSMGCFERAVKPAGERGALARALRRKITNTDAAALRATLDSENC